MAAPTVPWRDAWQEALYAAWGFYRREHGSQLGFSTSMHGVPHAPVIMARAVVTLAERYGLDTVVDIGAHHGELAEALARVGSALRYVGVDVTPQPPHTPGIDDWWQAPGGPALPDELRGMRGTLVMAHEWLDVVPAVVARKRGDGVWHEVCVDPKTGNHRPGPPVAQTNRRWLQQWVGPEVSIAEVGRSRDEALRDLLDRVEHGVVVVVDYGHHRHTRPAHGSLRGYQQGRQVDPVPDGSMDLTAHVAIDSLLAAVAPYPAWAQTQRGALLDLLGPAATPNHARAAADPRGYLAALAESGARTALSAPEAFGGYWWVCVDHTQVGPTQ